SIVGGVVHEMPAIRRPDRIHGRHLRGALTQEHARRTSHHWEQHQWLLRVRLIKPDFSPIARKPSDRYERGQVRKLALRQIGESARADLTDPDIKHSVAVGHKGNEL